MKHHVICLFQEPEKAETEPAKEEPKPEAKAKGAMGICRGSSMLSLRGSMYMTSTINSVKTFLRMLLMRRQIVVNFGVLGRT